MIVGSIVRVAGALAIFKLTARESFAEYMRSRRVPSSRRMPAMLLLAWLDSPARCAMMKKPHDEKDFSFASEIQICSLRNAKNVYSREKKLYSFRLLILYTSFIRQNCRDRKIDNMYILLFFFPKCSMFLTKGKNLKVLQDDISDEKGCIFPPRNSCPCLVKVGRLSRGIRKGDGTWIWKEKREPRGVTFGKIFLDGIKTAVNGRYFMHGHGVWYTVNKRQCASSSGARASVTRDA